MTKLDERMEKLLAPYLNGKGNLNFEGDVILGLVGNLQAENKRLRKMLLTVDGAWKKAPCCICGYNGPGYYDSRVHECAKLAAAALKGDGDG